MASLSEIYIKREIIETMYDVLQKRKEEKGLSITVSINDETNQYGQNVSSYISQSKEEREQKKQKFYVGNGKTFWTDGKINVAEKKAEDSVQDAVVIDDDTEHELPF